MQTALKAFYYLFQRREHVIETLFKDTENNDNKITEAGEDKITENSS